MVLRRVVLEVLLQRIHLDLVVLWVVGPPGSMKVHFRREGIRRHLRHHLRSRRRRRGCPMAAVHCRGGARDAEEVLVGRHMVRADCQAIDGVDPRRGLPQPPWFQKNQ